MLDAKYTKTLEDFFKHYTETSFKANQGIIGGNTPGGVFYLKSGFVRQYAVNDNGTELLVNLYKPETFFPMTWAIADIPNRHFFESVGPVQAWRAPKDAFVEFIKDQPEILLDLTMRLLQGLDAHSKRLELHTNGSAYHRVVHTLLTLADRFGDQKDPDSEVAININLNQYVLASFANTTKESFSRALGKLKNKNLVKRENNKIVISSLNDLTRELSL